MLSMYNKMNTYQNGRQERKRTKAEKISFKKCLANTNGVISNRFPCAERNTRTTLASLISSELQGIQVAWKAGSATAQAPWLASTSYCW